MGESYKQLSTNPYITVHFYGTKLFKTTSLQIPVDCHTTCEQVCIQSAKHLSENLGQYFFRESEKKIGPLLLPLFGLYAEDHALQRWVPDWYTFDSSCDQQGFYFRIRVRPLGTQSFWEKTPQGVFVDYLFWQCTDDFLKGRIWEQVGVENKINSVDAVNINAVRILVASAGYHLSDLVKCDLSQLLHKPLKDVAMIQDILSELRWRSWRALLPSKMSPELSAEYNFQKNLLMRFLAISHCKKYVRQFYEKSAKVCLNELRMGIVRSFITEFVPGYGLEMFSAEKLDKEHLPRRRVDMIIRPYQDGCSPGLYFSQKLVAPLHDILRVIVMDRVSANTECDVVVECRNQPPLFLQMASIELAESFFSILDMYYYLKVDYHASIRDNPQKPPSLRRLEMLRSYGPMREKAARQHLRDRIKEDKRPRGNTYYFIYEDCLEYNLMHVVGTVLDTTDLISYDIRYRPTQCESGYTFSLHQLGETEHVFETQDPRMLILHLNTQLIKGQRIYPKEDEICGAMHFFKDELTDDHYYSSVMSRDQMARKTLQDASEVPMLFREDQITVNYKTDRITRTEFCDVYRFKQIEQGREAVLKMVTDKKPAVQEAYRKGAELLLKLGEGWHLFIRVYGFMISSPVRIIFESMPHGSLLHRLRNREIIPINYFHVNQVLRQLTDCLHFLERKKLVYGSMSCAKILILSEKETEDGQHFTIRLGDPSRDLYLDTLDLSDSQNQLRLPWVAPERFTDLSKHTVASMMYSLGTTLWELLSHGQYPIDCIRGNVADFFTSGKVLPTSNFITASESQEETSNNVQGERNHLPGGQNDARTREWVVSQNQLNGIDNQDTDYMRAAANCSDDSTQTSAQTAETALTGNEVHNTEESSSTPWRKLQEYLVQMITDCWHKYPDQRPSPTELQKRCGKLRSLLEEAQKRDMNWQLSVFVRSARITGNVYDPEEAEILEQALKQTSLVKQREWKEDQERLQELKNRVRSVMKCSIIHSRLVFDPSAELGKGNFGKVLKAKLKDECESRDEQNCEMQDVAVKMIRDDARSPDDISRFLKEALCVYQLEHANVVKIHGVVMKGANNRNPYMLVMELADLGSLETHVAKNSTKLGLQWFRLILKKLAIDIAKGLEYFCEKNNRIHGDLAARNILLFSSDGRPPRNITAKLGDFGLSHELKNGYYDVRKSKSKNHQLPVYSLPPEVLQSYSTPELKFTIKTDVWSFGIVLWEMFTNKRPEEYLDPDKPEKPDFEKLLRRYQSSYRLPKLDYCPEKMYNIMMNCWKGSPDHRPVFSDLKQQLEDLTDNDMA